MSKCRNYLGIAEAGEWEHWERHWLWCVWIIEDPQNDPPVEPIEFGFADSWKEANQAAWDYFQRNNDGRKRIRVTHRNDWAESQLKENRSVEAALDRIRSPLREFYSRPNFSRCSVGKRRWYWVVGSEYDFDEDRYTEPLAEGFAESADAAMRDAEVQVGPVRLVSNRDALGYRQMNLAEARSKKTTCETTTTTHEFVYQCGDGYSNAHRIVKRTARYIYVEQDEAYFEPYGNWHDYARKTFRLDRATFEQTGKAERKGRLFRTYYADPEVYQAERRQAALPECLVHLGLESCATEQDVSAAYRRLALQHHPDAGGDAEEFKQIQSAYEEALEIVPISQPASTPT